ncbi:hypothetical protein [Polyangium sp. y55x31]|uniref:hypothetical protein n=1 Tax=Polyangium sp. y55x31 TaxID=3042688 RepID=UPI0024830BE5|nr:hypothetical protein [Polyangium sp. y55x31]MDI1484647.1 hypothetical protein [Polyangium sp. y55x31]
MKTRTLVVVALGLWASACSDDPGTGTNGAAGSGGMGTSGSGGMGGGGAGGMGTGGSGGMGTGGTGGMGTGGSGGGGGSGGMGTGGSGGMGTGGSGGMGTGGTGGMGTGGAGGMGGTSSASSGAQICVPGAMKSCYDGPGGTEGVGTCLGGMSTCLPDGSGFGPCEGEVLPATDDCKTAVDEDCNGANATCPGSTSWSRRFGSNIMEQTEEKLGGLAVDAGGDVLITGDYLRSMDFGGGLLLGNVGYNLDGFVAKLDGTGQPIWARNIASTNALHMRGVCVDPQGNVAVVGDTTGGGINAGGGLKVGTGSMQTFVVSYDAEGNHRFSLVSNGSASAYAKAVACGPDGSIAMVGTFTGNLTFGGNQINGGGSPGDAFAVKFSGDGQVIFTKRYGDTAFQTATGAAFDSQGRLVIAGYNTNTINFGVATLDKGLFVARLSATGEHVASRSFPEDAANQSQNLWVRVAAGPDDTLVLTTDSGDKPMIVDLGIAGPQNGTFFMVKLDASTAPVWGRAFTGAGGLKGVTFGNNGDVVVTGALRGSVDFGNGTAQTTAGASDIVVASYSAADGAFRWSRVEGDFDSKTLPQWGEAVGVNAAGQIYVGGSFEGAIHWGDQEHVASFGYGGLYSSDVFVASLAP